ncbi:DUF2283 domain-containing protein [Thermoflexus hugenholtzii]
MKVRYDREADILAIERLPGSVIDHAEHTGSLIARFTADGRLVLLEILDARRFLAQVPQAALQGEGVST